MAYKNHIHMFLLLHKANIARAGGLTVYLTMLGYIFLVWECGALGHSGDRDCQWLSVQNPR